MPVALSYDEPMKIWVISQDVNGGYDTYDSAVVIAATEEDARNMHPSGSRDKKAWKGPGAWYYDWAHTPDQVKVELIGDALEDEEPRVVVASFNAG